MKDPKNVRKGRNVVVWFPSYPAALPASLEVSWIYGAGSIAVITPQRTERPALWNAGRGRWEIGQPQD